MGYEEKAKIGKIEKSKYRARLKAHWGSMIMESIYWKTSPVVAWTTIRLLITLSKVHNWHTRQIDFVLVYPKAKSS